MNKKVFKSILYFFLGILFLWMSFYLYNRYVKNEVQHSDLKSFEEIYQEKEQQLKNLNKEVLQIVQSSNEKEAFKKVVSFNESHQKDGFSFFVYKNKKLFIWTDNKLFQDEVLESNAKIEDVTLLKNGWYRRSSTRNDSLYVLGTFLIKNEFPYENKDLVNHFHADFNFPYEGQIEKTTQPEYAIEGSNQASSFSVIPSKKIKVNEGLEVLFLSIFIFGILFLVVIANQLIPLKLSGLVLSVFLLFIRYWQLKSGYVLFSEMHIFQPDIFASSEWYPSFGDLILNTFVYLACVFFLVKGLFAFKEVSYKLKIFRCLLISSTLILSGLYTNYIINSLIENSNIVFQLDQFFKLSWLSFIGLLIIGLHFFIFIYLSRKWMRDIIALKVKVNILFSILFLVLIVVLFWAESPIQFYEIVWPFILLSLAGWMEWKFNEKYSFSVVLILLLIISGYTSFLISHLNYEKEQRNRLAYAERLVTDEDPLTEIEYDRIYKKIKKSPFLHQLYFDSLFLSKSEIDVRVENLFFSKFWEKYDLNFNYFDRDSLPIDIRTGRTKAEFEELNELIEDKGIASQINPNIYFIPDFSQQINYIIAQPILFEDSLIGNFYVSLRSKKIPEQIGFPKLMLDKNTKTIEELSNYSVSRYTEGELVTKFGSYNYPLNDSLWQNKLKDNYVFTNFENYSHLVYKINDKSMAVISKKSPTVYNTITSFSYIFTYFGLLLLLFFFFINFPEGIKIANYSLNAKIQLLSISLVILTLFAFVYGSSIYLKDQYYEKSVNQFKEKVNSVELELQQKLGKEDAFTPFLKNYSEGILQKFSNVFNTDINLYNKEGMLFASSRPKMFSVGLLAPIINPQAYEHVIINRKSEFIHSESIGQLEYLSAYAPLINNKGELLGYLNLQYFSKQNELEQELASLIVAIINIFVLLFAISVISTIFVSNWMTKPIKVISESLKRIELGKKNETIKYSGNDEIGDLVREYNQKVEELEKNAEQLAKSERESAWREMAKQVAHEIKNPLTPMKLSVQHLQRSFDQNAPDAEEKIQRITQSLVEQIDGLTHIANAFSNFAKLPQPENEEVDLKELLLSCISLYEQKEKVNITLESEIEKPVVVLDRSLITRVFNNLIINAIQAIPEDREGKIIVKIYQEAPYMMVAIHDNGKGVSEELKDKIFSPNFTTKSTGTGLGLAMVKNIVESYKGKVEFTSEVDKGSVFYVGFKDEDG